MSDININREVEVITIPYGQKKKFFIQERLLALDNLTEVLLHCM